MKIIVAAFYADVPGEPSRFGEFLPYVLASRRALAATNPAARYVVLTDPPTGELFTRRGVENVPIAETAMPLMLKIIDAQRAFVGWVGMEADLIVLPDVDCLANRQLDDAIPAGVGLAITHKGPKFRYKINNLAFVRDRELGLWFLDRAFGILKGWPVDKQIWGGDQEAWQSALGVPMPGLGYYVVAKEMKGDILVACPEDRTVHVYPCATHNCPMPDDGWPKAAQRAAYFVHFKGPRKQYLERWMAERFGDAT